MPRKTAQKKLVADPDTIRQALAELGVNRPFYTCRVVGDRIEFAMYGGDVIVWPSPKAAAKKEA